MNKLQFSTVYQAFTLGSSQIKDTKEEIARLKKLIVESNKNEKSKEEPLKSGSGDTKQSPIVGFTGTNPGVFSKQTPEDNFDFNIMKVIGHPKFDDVVKNYALVHHPEWLVREQNPSQSKSTFLQIPVLSKFGQNASSELRNYILFFVTCVVLFVILSFYFK